MKLFSVCLSVLSISLLLACSATKKNTKSDTKAATSMAKPELSKDGVFAPGENELKALQVKYKGLEMATLEEGYSIYRGACTRCHNAKSIYSRSVEQWQKIIDEMAPKARLNSAQKDAVHKYVLAIKETQTKQ